MIYMDILSKVEPETRFRYNQAHQDQISRQIFQD
jgi:hypothetical protein